MKLEDQVCSLEASQRLSNLGISSTGSYLRWFDDGNKKYVCDMFHDATSETEDVNEIGAAFSIAELIKMLPEKIEIHKSSNDDGEIGYTVYYYRKDGMPYISMGVSLPNTIVGTLTSLLKTGIVTAEECNKRLLS